MTWFARFRKHKTEAEPKPADAALAMLRSKTAQERFQGAKLLVELGPGLRACSSHGDCKRLVKKLDEAVIGEREVDIRFWLRMARDKIAAKPGREKIAVRPAV